MSDDLLTLPEDDFITSYAIALALVQEAVTSHDSYWKLIKAWQEHIDGKKPNDPETLKKKGMSWASNINFGKARAKIEKGTAESVALVSTAIALGYPSFRNEEEEDKNDPILSFLADPNRRGIVCSAIGLSLYQTLSRETRLSGWLNQLEYPSYSFGYSVILFNEFDWMPSAVHPLHIAFKPQTKPEDIKAWVTFDVIDAIKLYKKWVTTRKEVRTTITDGENTVQIASAGWILEGLEGVLLNAYRGKVNGNETPESWTQVIPDYINNPSGVISQTDSVGIAKLHYMELDGSLTVVYIPWENSWQASEKTAILLNQSKGNNIIFKKKYPKFDQKEWVGLIRDSGFTSASGYIQELRGIAKFAVENSIGYNRLRNGINNKMQFVGSPFFEQGASQVEKFKLSVSQGFVLIPSGHSLVTQQPTFDISNHINVLRFEESEYNRDTQQFDASIQGRLTSRPNKGEVQAVSSEVEFLDRAKNVIKFRDYASCLFTVLQRLPTSKIADGDPGKEGRDRFYQYVKRNLKGIIEIKDNEDVDKVLGCIESYTIEAVISDVDSITVALQLCETPFGRNRLKRMLMVAKGFPIEEVNISVPLILDKYSNLSDSRVAAIENDMMFTTNEIILSGGDDHVVHLDSHLAKAERIVMGVKEQALSPVDAFKFLEICLQHCMAHNDMLMAVPAFKDKAEEYQQKISALNQATNQIRIVAEQIMQAKQQEASQLQMDPEKQAKIALAAQEAQATSQRKDWVIERRTEQRERQIDLDHKLKERQLELEAQNGK